MNVTLISHRFHSVQNFFPFVKCAYSIYIVIKTNHTCVLGRLGYVLELSDQSQVCLSALFCFSFSLRFFFTFTSATVNKNVLESDFEPLCDGTTRLLYSSVYSAFYRGLFPDPESSLQCKHYKWL